MFDELFTVTLMLPQLVTLLPAEHTPRVAVPADTAVIVRADPFMLVVTTDVLELVGT